MMIAILAVIGAITVGGAFGLAAARLMGIGRAVAPIPSTKRQLEHADKANRADLRTAWSGGIRLDPPDALPTSLHDFDHLDNEKTRP